MAEGSFRFEDDFSIDAGDSLETCDYDITLSGNGVVYVCGAEFIPENVPPRLCKITRSGAHYKVSKPWGYELWINGTHPLFCAKKIFIKQGTQTSLQYHNFKEESNLIESGTAILVSQADMSIELDDVKSEHLQEQEISGPVYFHVAPRTIHRLRAVTDLHLFEVSTPFLDDVIRL